MRGKRNALLAAGGATLCLFGLAHAQQSATPDSVAITSLSNAKQIALGCLMYSQDYDETLPTGRTMAQVKPKLMPYIKSEAVFNDPTSNKPFSFNGNLSGKRMKSVLAPAKTVLFYSPAVYTDGLFTIAYLDGHCKREKAVPALTAGKASSTRKHK